MIRKAVILAAGVGTRLRPFTNKLPKCLVKVAGVPILDNTLAHLASLGTEEIAIVVGHHKEVIIERFGASGFVHPVWPTFDRLIWPTPSVSRFSW